MLEVESEGVTNPASEEVEVESKKSLSPKLKKFSLAGNNIWRNIQGYLQRQPLRLSRNYARMSLTRFQRRNHLNKVIRGQVRHLHHGNPTDQNFYLCSHRKFYLQHLWPLHELLGRLQDQRRHALVLETEEVSQDGTFEIADALLVVWTPRRLHLTEVPSVSLSLWSAYS